MRLSSQDLQQMIRVLNTCLGARLSKAELRLFGSRVKDQAKGGDIDLLLILPNTQAYQQVLDQKLILLVELKQYLGDQKIDLILATPSLLSTDPFLELIYTKAIILNTWPSIP